jgi:maleate isomerase
MSVEYASRGLVGALTPQANTTVEPEFSILWPAGISMINARMLSPKAQLEDRLLDYFGQLDSAVAQFANAPIDVVAFACTGASYLVGVENERATSERLSERLGIPFLTAGMSVTASLQLLNAKRIGLVSPYPASITETSIGYWTQSGFAVEEVAEVTGDTSSFHPIYSIRAGSAREGLAALQDKDIDAIVMLGTGMPTLEPIIEARSNRIPVMSCMLCLAWACVDSIEKISGPVRKQTLLSWIRGDHWAEQLYSRKWPPANEPRFASR